MLRTTTIGLVSIIALGVGLASPAAGMGNHPGGGGSGGGSMRGASTGGGSMQSGGSMRGASTGGGSMQSGGVGRSSMMAVRSDSSPGRLADHDMGRMRMGEDHDRGRDHDRDRHDHDRFRFFPSFAFGLNTYYADTYDPGYSGCWELHRVWSHGAWRLHRFWVCN